MDVLEEMEQWVCLYCGHTESFHWEKGFLACQGAQTKMNRNWCDCTEFIDPTCIYPRLPTAEEMYEVLRSSGGQ